MVCEGYPSLYREGEGWWCPKDKWHRIRSLPFGAYKITEAEFEERYPDLPPLREEAFAAEEIE